MILSKHMHIYIYLYIYVQVNAVYRYVYLYRYIYPQHGWFTVADTCQRGGGVIWGNNNHVRPHTVGLGVCFLRYEAPVCVVFSGILLDFRGTPAVILVLFLAPMLPFVEALAIITFFVYVAGLCDMFLRLFTLLQLFSLVHFKN